MLPPDSEREARTADSGTTPRWDPALLRGRTKYLRLMRDLRRRGLLAFLGPDEVKEEPGVNLATAEGLSKLE
eukprot:3793528-Pyramimonas_sp.AAC.1